MEGTKGHDGPGSGSPPVPERPEFGEDWLVAVLDSLDEAVIALDADGRFVAANPSAEKLLGFIANAVRGWPFETLGWDRAVPVDGSDPVSATLGDGRPRRHVLVRLPRGQEHRWLRVNTTVMPFMSAESRSGIVVSLTDVTGEVLAQEALRRHADELERVNEQLRRADAMRSDFLAMSSHELRTPLASLLGYVEVLTGDWEHLSETERLGCLDAIDVQGHQLLRLVDALLTTTRIESGDLVARTAPTAVVELVSSAVAETATTAEVRVEVEGDLHVRVDPEHGRRVLVALIANAATHGQPPVVVEAAAAADVVELRVRDRGPGVRPEFVPHLFERFAQGSTGTTRHPGGVGLGLTIADGLTRLNGGSLRYESNVPSGACFIVRLPAASA